MTAVAPRVSQIVTFRLGDELFAADIFSVERVLRYTPPTPVPNVPAWIDGVIDYQGRVVPVIDLRKRFELPEAPVPADGRILVLTVDGEWVAVTVDGEPIGKVAAVLRTGGTEVLVIDAADGREVLVPFAESICTEVDVEGKRITVDPPDGLLEF